MEHLVWLLPTLLIGFVVWHRWRLPNLNQAADRAARANDLQLVVAAIKRRRPQARPAAYNRAIRHLWDSYQRPLAIRLVRQLASEHGDSAIAQYWIKQVLTVEPQVAGRLFDQAFLKRYYRPEVAARCGPVG